jgi:nucleotide-binding universal stress UspA family protein
MLHVKNILLASHGTEGALAAEQKAFDYCVEGAVLHHLIVVPTLWKGMTGDDWLNNGSTRNAFCDYLEGELEKEVRSHLERMIEKTDELGISYQHEVVVGELEDCLLKSSRKRVCDLVVIGSPRPKGKSGLRSRMRLEPLVRGLSVPLMVVPYPDA